jgi:hypothetical protein
MQCAVIEFARDECGLAGANSSEFDPHSPHPVIDLMDEQRDVVEMGGTMRLGAYPAKLREGSVVRNAYGSEVIYERHRHRYEVNNRYRHRLEDAGLLCSGTSPDDRLVEFVELAPSVHPFFVATQAHPEFKSRPDRPHPLFAAFLRAAKHRADGRAPKLPIEALERSGRTLDAVILVDVPNDQLVERLTARRQCRDCGRIYNVLADPPEVEGVCDLCGGEVYQRDDDTVETVSNRLAVYDDQTAPLIAYYRDKGVLKPVDGTKSMDEVFAEIVTVLG